MLLPKSYVGSGNNGFICRHCGAEVPAASNGTYRNHCPFCLWSCHVDEAPGDRASQCGGLMEPYRLINHSRKGYQVVHRCTDCGVLRPNRLVESGDTPDDPEAIRWLAVQQA